MNPFFVLGQDEGSVGVIADKAVFVGVFWFRAFLADELSYFIVDGSLLRFEVITTFVDFAVAFGADQDFEAFWYFFGRDFAELGETDVAVGFENVFVKFFISC